MQVPETLVDEVHDALANSDIFGSWAAAERIRAKSSHVPARTMDEVVEDDPYRVIMFSDIESFMIQLPHRSKALRDWCIDAFLLFCRLPAMSPSTISRGWANDAFVRDELLEYSSQSIKQEYSAAAHDESQEAGKPAFLHIPSPNCLSAPELLFGKTTIGNGMVHHLLILKIMLMMIEQSISVTSVTATQGTTALYPTHLSAIL